MKNSGSGPMKQVSATPEAFRYASAFFAMCRGSRVNSLPLTGSTMLAMTLMVGFSKNGSRRVVSASGTASMSDSWMPIHPRIDDPSNPRPSLNVSLSR